MEVRLVSETKIDQSYLMKLMTECEVGDDSFDFISNVQDLEGLIAYIARVSSSNQKNPNYALTGTKYFFRDIFLNSLTNVNSCATVSK